MIGGGGGKSGRVVRWQTGPGDAEQCGEGRHVGQSATIDGTGAVTRTG